MLALVSIGKYNPRPANSISLLFSSQTLEVFDMTSGAADTITNHPWMRSETTNPKTDSPPPAYTVLPSEHEQPAATSSRRQIPPVSPSLASPNPCPSTPNPQPIPSLQPLPLPYAPSPETRPPHFGPTPLSSQYPLLPYAYYDSPAVAEERARWRFVGALMCGVGMWVVVGGAVGSEIVWGGRLFDWL